MIHRIKILFCVDNVTLLPFSAAIFAKGTYQASLALSKATVALAFRFL